MVLKNPEIFSVIDAVGEHYRTNISTRHTRRALSSMNLDPGTWNLIEELTEKVDTYRYQGYHLDELYSQILAIARFVYQARRQVLPNIRFLASSSSGAERSDPGDKVIREMALNNLGPNLKILADKVNELYVKIVSIDKETARQKVPVFSQISELREIGRYLVE
jgi:hypothetical protein